MGTDRCGQVNLYHMAEMVIKSSTQESQLSMVEQMSLEEMPPDYFVSHWWGVYHSAYHDAVCLPVSRCAMYVWRSLAVVCDLSLTVSLTMLSACVSR